MSAFYENTNLPLQTTNHIYKNDTPAINRAHYEDHLVSEHLRSLAMDEPRLPPPPVKHQAAAPAAKAAATSKKSNAHLYDDVFDDFKKNTTVAAARPELVHLRATTVRLSPAVGAAMVLAL